MPDTLSDDSIHVFIIRVLYPTGSNTLWNERAAGHTIHVEHKCYYCLGSKSAKTHGDKHADTMGFCAAAVTHVVVVSSKL